MSDRSPGLTTHQLAEMLLELPNIPVLVKDTKAPALVEIVGVLDAERVYSDTRAAVLRFYGDETGAWWRGVSTPDDEWQCYKERPQVQPGRLGSRLTSAANALIVARGEPAEALMLRALDMVIDEEVR